MDKTGFIIITANTLNEALIKGANYIGAKPEDLEYEILDKSDKYKVKIFYKSKNHFINKGLSEQQGDIENIDGYFKIGYKDGFANLIVYPPAGKGKPVYIEDVLNRMKLLNIPKTDFIKIREIINFAEGTSVTLTEWEHGLDYRASLEIKISDDKMKAVMLIRSAKKGNDWISLENVKEEIDSLGIIFGLNDELIKTVVKNKLYDKEVVIAEGKLPVIESESNVTFYFDTNPGIPFLLDEQGKINLKELNFIQNKKKDEVLAIIVKNDDNETGMDILGNILFPPDRKKYELKAGHNVYRSEDNLKLIAKIDGNANLKGNVVNVDPVLNLRLVDYSCGNLDFNGSIVISEGIADGFTVNATGTIQIGDCVGKVYIKSGGNILLKSGVNGNKEGFIECDGDLYARFIESANIRCRGNLIVEEAIMHSNISVDGNVILTGKRSELIGGVSIIGKYLKCKKLGNINGIKTIVSMGFEPDKIRLIEEMKAEISKKKEAIKILTDKKHKTEKMIIDNNINERLKDHLNKLLMAIARLSDDLSNIEKDYKEANLRLTLNKDSIVFVEQTIFNDTEISFGNDVMKVTTKEKNKVKLRYAGGRIIESGFIYDEFMELMREKIK